MILVDIQEIVHRIMIELKALSAAAATTATHKRAPKTFESHVKMNRATCTTATNTTQHSDADSLTHLAHTMIEVKIHRRNNTMFRGERKYGRKPI